MPTAEALLAEPDLDDAQTGQGTPDLSAAAAQPEVPVSTGTPLPEIRPATEQIATYEALMAKRRRRDKVIVPTVNEDGETVELVVKLEAIDGPAFDKLSDTYPPTTEQLSKGALFNGKKFIPALLEACVTEPRLTMAQWTALRENPNWAGGEFSHLFNAAWRLCNGGLDVNFTVTG